MTSSQLLAHSSSLHSWPTSLYLPSRFPKNKISNGFSQTQFSRVPLRKLYWSLLLITSIPVWVCQKETFNECFEIHFQDENGQLYDSPFFLIYMCERSASKGSSGSYLNGLLLTVNWKKQIFRLYLLHCFILWKGKINNYICVCRIFIKHINHWCLHAWI